MLENDKPRRTQVLKWYVMPGKWNVIYIDKLSYLFSTTDPEHNSEPVTK